MIADIEIARKLLQIEQSAKSRNIPFDLTFQDVKRVLTAKRCFFTGAILTDVVGSPNKLSFDRIDNTKGYITGNVVACSESFNKTKNNLTVNDIVLLYKGLKRKKII